MKSAFAIALALSALGSLEACASNNPPSECLGETEGQALSVCSMTKTVQGVDVSVYQSTVNWASVKSAGNAFAFVRVSDGASTSDTQFASNWPGAKKAGLIRGAYQFFRASEDPTAQANLFVSKMNAAGGIGAGDLPPVLDLETADGESNATVVSRALTWLSVMEQKTGIKPIVYTAAFMSATIGTSFSKYPLWVANYEVTCPTMPSGWTAWQFWQDSSKGTVGGISGAVDTDIFNGDLATLQKLTLQTAADAGSNEDAGASEPQSAAPGAGRSLGNGSAMGAGGTGDPSATPNDAPLPSASAPADPCTH